MDRAIIAALAALTAGLAAADGRPDPSLPQGKPAPSEYRSAFDGYRPFAEEKPTRWRDANETVKNADSHGGHGQKPSADPKPASKPAPGNQDHGGHK